MNFKGTKLSGSSILTILGVVCFATVLVAAAVLTSSITAFNSTNVTDPGELTITKTAEDPAAYTGDTATYQFTANVPDDLTGATLTIRIAESVAVATGDVTSLSVNWNNGGAQSQTIPDASGGYITIVYDIGAVTANSAVPCTITVVYANAGTYTLDVQISGTASS